ncbi:flagellar basal body-associated FliL family protein [Roseococcus sp. SDR]|uniref:flagellar basal body-associated FliL family protein n=1 Tax=Roseococcus sp. SDR TaxID=2835532 RepID=UPI001BCD71A0|nr:flagellar basal body-associated FliL family protein [Roseococcus sp. SDR]MBS7789974.1 flagellar basal body-associated FliL family protein [Roseococcus sp. SDR]MBV1845288.1 flagellar basal body-associated FliL family protein [Roseococcus sp. SDR]
MAAAKGEEAAGEAEAKPRGSKKKLLLLALPLLLGGVGAGVWFSGILSPAPPPAPAAEAEPQPVNRQPVFVNMPDITANLNAPGRRAFIRVKSQVEVAGPADAAALQAAMPRLVDLFTTYLREVRPEELRGSAGTHRLREELIARANVAAAPVRVTDVLFTEILVQ